MKSSSTCFRILDDFACFALAALISFSVVFGAATAYGQAATANKSRDLAQEVQRAAYLSDIHGKTNREVLAIINHKLDLLLDLHRQHMATATRSR